jgi:recombination protein RecT
MTEQPDPPANRRVNTEDIAARLARSRDDGLPRAELTELRTDAAALIQDELRKMQNDFAQANPRMDADMVVRDACIAVGKPDAGLWEADPATVLGAAMSACQLSLRVGVGGESWILPFWDGLTRSVKAQLIIGYQGYITMCYGSGRVLSMLSEVAYEREHEAGAFDFTIRQDGPHLLHKPDLSIPTRQSCPACNETNPNCDYKASHGELIHAFYAQARTKGNGLHVTRPYGLEMMRWHRDRYAKKDRYGRKTPFWRDNFIAAGRKTMAREVTRMLPKSRAMANALAADDGVRDTFHFRTEPGEATVHSTDNVIDLDVVADTMQAQTTHPADR